MKHSLFLVPLFASVFTLGALPAFAADAASKDKVTKTVQKTTTTSYTVTSRRVGMVGGRPYPEIVRNVEGGEKIETYVNDAKVDTRIVRPEPELPQPEQLRRKSPYVYPFREYYTNTNSAAVLKQVPSDVIVRDTGNFND